MKSILPQQAASLAVPESSRSARNMLILGDSGGLNRTRAPDFSTGPSTVASIYNHETKLIRLIISLANAHLQITAHTRRCTLTPVPVLLRRIPNSIAPQILISSSKSPNDSGSDFIMDGIFGDNNGTHHGSVFEA